MKRGCCTFFLVQQPLTEQRAGKPRVVFSENGPAGPGCVPLSLGLRSSPNYMERSASIGLRRLAFRAGAQPNRMPTAAEKPTPSAMAP